MQLLYREEVASLLKGESPMSCHPSLPSAAETPCGGAALQGRGRESSIWGGMECNQFAEGAVLDCRVP